MVLRDSVLQGLDRPLRMKNHGFEHSGYGSSFYSTTSSPRSKSSKNVKRKEPESMNKIKWTRENKAKA